MYHQQQIPGLLPKELCPAFSISLAFLYVYVLTSNRTQQEFPASGRTELDILLNNKNNNNNNGDMR
jgi:hypothetical protein